MQNPAAPFRAAGLTPSWGCNPLWDDRSDFTQSRSVILHGVVSPEPSPRHSRVCLYIQVYTPDADSRMAQDDLPEMLGQLRSEVQSGHSPTRSPSLSRSRESSSLTGLQTSRKIRDSELHRCIHIHESDFVDGAGWAPQVSEAELAARLADIIETTVPPHHPIDTHTHTQIYI